MQGTNPTEFEKWCAKEMGHTVEYMAMQRKPNIFGVTEYKHEEIDKRYRAWRASWRERAIPFINGQWVKCSEKMPPEDTSVLCCDIDSLSGDMFIADFIKEFTFGKREVLTGFYRGERQAVVTHWMPLPPMPEKK